MTEAVGKVADRAALVEDMSDLDRILKEGKWAFIRSIESGAALGGKLENVDHFAKLNFKMMTLTGTGSMNWEAVPGQKWVLQILEKQLCAVWKKWG